MLFQPLFDILKFKCASSKLDCFCSLHLSIYNLTTLSPRLVVSGEYVACKYVCVAFMIIIDNISCSSGTQVLSKEKSSHLVNTSELKPFSSSMDIRDNSAKLLNAHHHYNLSRSVFLKRSRHHYGHQYSRRNSGNHGTSSHGKAPALHDDRLSFKLASQCNTVPGSNPINREKSFSGPERIRLSSLVTDATSPDAVKMVCGICKKLLRRKPFFLGMGNTLASGEYAVVAVLVCCHVYHADCLEQKTSLEDIRDPPCPLCLGLLSQVESPGEQV